MPLFAHNLPCCTGATISSQGLPIRGPHPLLLALREWTAHGGVPRHPEPEAMEGAESVAAFDAMGAAALRPVYLAAIARLSPLVPAGGRVLDLGCGGGRFLCAFLLARPDCTGIGLDLSPAMLERARANAGQAGVAARATFLAGDMTAPLLVPAPAAVACLFALHHLPDLDALRRCLAAIADLRRRHGCALWLFDHHRPRHPRTADDLPASLTPEAPAAFRHDSAASLRAAWSAGELAGALAGAGLPGGALRVSRLLPVYQHLALAARTGAGPPAGTTALWPQDRAAHRRARLLGWMLGGGVADARPAPPCERRCPAAAAG